MASFSYFLPIVFDICFSQLLNLNQPFPLMNDRSDKEEDSDIRISSLDSPDASKTLELPFEDFCVHSFREDFQILFNEREDFQMLFNEHLGNKEASLMDKPNIPSYFEEVGTSLVTFKRIE